MTSKKKVVVIDDILEVCEVLELFLSDDYDVKSFENPNLALDYLRDHKVDLVLTDYNMKPINGLEILKFVKSSSQTPVVVISGQAIDNKLLEQFNSHGLDGIVSKPFRDAELQEMVARLTGGVERKVG